MRGSRLRLAGKADPAAKAQLCVGSAQELQFMKKTKPDPPLEIYTNMRGGSWGKKSGSEKKSLIFFFFPDVNAGLLLAPYGRRIFEGDLKPAACI